MPKIVRPAFAVPIPLWRYAQQLGDDNDRQGSRELPDEVECASGGKQHDQAACHLSDVLLQTGDPSRGKGAIGELA